MDAEAAVLAVDEKFSRRPSVMSHQQYGPVTGVPRLLEMLGGPRTSVRASSSPASPPNATLEPSPAIVEGGHEVCHHGYLHRPPGLIDAATERSELERGLAALERIAGVRATIFRAPWWETSTATFDLLLEYGFTCDSSLFDRDVPYRLGIGSSELIEVPVSWALDDWEKYAFLPDPPTGSGRDRVPVAGPRDLVGGDPGLPRGGRVLRPHDAPVPVRSAVAGARAAGAAGASRGVARPVDRPRWARSRRTAPGRTSRCTRCRSRPSARTRRAGPANRRRRCEERNGSARHGGFTVDREGGSS